MLGAHNDHPLYFTYRFYRRLLPVLERVRQGVESQQPPVVEVEYPYPVVSTLVPSTKAYLMLSLQALLSELHTSQNGNNSHVSQQLATPASNSVEVDELWNFILGEDSGMGQIFTA